MNFLPWSVTGDGARGGGRSASSVLVDVAAAAKVVDEDDAAAELKLLLLLLLLLPADGERDRRPPSESESDRVRECLRERLCLWWR